MRIVGVKVRGRSGCAVKWGVGRTSLDMSEIKPVSGKV